MQYFTPEEFGDDYGLMSPRILRNLDEFRKLWGAPVHVSPVKNALARWLGADKLSGHNVDKWGFCEAVDVFPEGMKTPEDFERAYICMKRVGVKSRHVPITGFGIYTDTKFRRKKHPMLHLDTRPDRTAETRRLWSRVDGEYLALAEVMPSQWQR